MDPGVLLHDECHGQLGVVQPHRRLHPPGLRSSGTADGVALAAKQVVRAASRPLDALFWRRWTKCVRRAWWQQAQGEPVSNVVASGWPQQPTLVAPATRCCVALLAPFFCFAAFRLVFCSNFCSNPRADPGTPWHRVRSSTGPSEFSRHSLAGSGRRSDRFVLRQTFHTPDQVDRIMSPNLATGGLFASFL